MITKNGKPDMNGGSSGGGAMEKMNGAATEDFGNGPVKGGSQQHKPLPSFQK